MKLIIKRKKVNNSNKSKNSMAKAKTRTRSRSRLGSAKAFSGKVLGMQIPFVSRVFKNKSVQQVMAAQGAVKTFDDIALLANNATLNQIQSNPLVRAAEAGAGGGTLGLLVSFVRQGGLGLLGRSGNGGAIPTGGAA